MGIPDSCGSGRERGLWRGPVRGPSGHFKMGGGLAATTRPNSNSLSCDCSGCPVPPSSSADPSEAQFPLISKQQTYPGPGTVGVLLTAVT